MKKKLKTVDWFIIVTAILDFIVFLLFLLVSSCGRIGHDFTEPAVAADDFYDGPSELPSELPSDDVSHANDVGNSGELKITLLWDFPGDIDLHVFQPNGKEIFYRRSSDSQTTGSLDVDNTRGGYGSAENIYWSNPIPGDYKVSLVYFQKSTSTGEIGSGVCRVVVFQKDVAPKTYNIDMSAVGQERYVTTIRQ